MKNAVSEVIRIIEYYKEDILKVTRECRYKKIISKKDIEKTLDKM